MLSVITQIIEGQGCLHVIIHLVDILEGIKMLFDNHGKFSREAPRRCNRSVMPSSQGNGEAKGYYNHR